MAARKVRHASIPLGAADLTVAAEAIAAVAELNHNNNNNAAVTPPESPDSATLAKRRKTVSEDIPGGDRNSVRLGFLSYNTMMLKRRKSKKRITDSAEWLYPIPKTEGLEAGENNKMQTRTKYTLEALLIANNMAVLSAIIKAMNPTEAEEICGALLAVFHCNGKGHNLILWTMERELKVEKVPENLFRGVSLAASLMSKYFRMSASDYLRSILRPIVKEVKTKDMRIEVDPARIKEDPGESLRENQTKLIHLSKLVFDLLVASLDQFPHAVKNIFHAAQQAVSERFPEMGHQFVGGFYFLRFICPALVAPAAYGLVKSDLAPENQRTLILISKVLQNLSNHILFGEKEPFMMFMNPFINKNSRKMADCLQTLVKKASESAPTQNGKFFQMSAGNEKLKNEALISVTRCMCDHLDDVIAELERAGQGKLHNVLLDSLRAVAMLAKTTGVNINHAALAARTRDSSSRSPSPLPFKGDNGDEYDQDDDSADSDSDSISTLHPQLQRGSSDLGPGQDSAVGEEEAVGATLQSVRSAELPAVRNSGRNKIKRGHRLSSPLAALSTSDTSVLMRRNSLDREYASDDLANLINHHHNNDNPLAHSGERQLGEADNSRAGKVRINLSLGELPPPRKETEKEKIIRKLEHKLERIHRLNRAPSPRESAAAAPLKESTNPLYNPVQRPKSKDPLPSPRKDQASDANGEKEAGSRFVRLKSLIGNSSDDDLVPKQEVRTTQNILLNYIKAPATTAAAATSPTSNHNTHAAEETMTFTVVGRSEGPPVVVPAAASRSGVELIESEKRRSLSASDIKGLHADSVNQLASLQLAAATTKGSKKDKKRGGGGGGAAEGLAGYLSETPLVMRDVIIAEQKRRIDAERELVRVKTELEAERRARMEAELKLDIEAKRAAQAEKEQLKELEAERLKRIEAEMRLEIERARWTKSGDDDGRELETERRRRIEAELVLQIEHEKWQEDYRLLESERRKRIEAEMRLEIMERARGWDRATTGGGGPRAEREPGSPDSAELRRRPRSRGGSAIGSGGGDDVEGSSGSPDTLRRHRGRERDEEGDRDRERGGRDSRSRERSRERERGPRDSSRERSRERDSSRERSRERSREGERGPSRDGRDRD